MTKIIFQDVDGPLIPLRMYFGGNRPFDVNAGSFIYDPVAVAMINHLCSQYGALMVYNSAHNENSPENMKHQATRNGLVHQHEDIKTNFDVLHDFGRHAAIKEWLSRHPEVTDWIVIDDMPVYLPKQVHVNYSIGMTIEDFQRADYLLSGKEPSKIIGIGQKSSELANQQLKGKNK